MIGGIESKCCIRAKIIAGPGGDENKARQTVRLLRNYRLAIVETRVSVGGRSFRRRALCAICPFARLRRLAFSTTAFPLHSLLSPRRDRARFHINIYINNYYIHVYISFASYLSSSRRRRRRCQTASFSLYSFKNVITRCLINFIQTTSAARFA